MPWVRPSLQEIIQRLDTDIETGLLGRAAMLPKAVLRVLSRAFALAVHCCYGFIAFLSEQRFVDLAVDEYLLRLAAEKNVFPLPGAFAQGTVFIDYSGTGYTLLSSMILVSQYGHEYVATADTEIVFGGSLVGIRSVEVGINKNLVASEVLTLAVPNSEVLSITVDSSGIVGGVDAETIESVRSRTKQRKINPSTGGNRGNYEEWSKEVAGVDRAWCFPQTPQSGHITVAIRASGADPVPSNALIAEIENHIEQYRAVRATIHLQKIVPVSIRFEIAITPNAPGLQDNVESAIENCFLENAALGANHYSFPANTANLTYAIPISKIRAAIGTSGVENYDIVSIEAYIGSTWTALDETADIEFTGYDHPVLDSITFGTL